MEGAIETAKAELKASLRNALLQNIQPSVIPNDNPSDAAVPSGSSLTHAQIAAFLKQSGFHFALSVFLAEAGLTSKKPDFSLDPKGIMIIPKDDSKQKRRELEEVIVNIWERFEKFYSEKFDKEIAIWERVQQDRIRALEAQMQSKLKESQRQIKANWDRQRSKIKNEEAQIKADLNRQKSRQEEEQQMQREDLLDQLRQIEVARFELKNLEETFMRFQDSEKAKLRVRSEQIQMMEIQAKKNEIEFSQRVEAAVADALDLERQKIHERVRVMNDRDNQAQEMIKELKSNISKVYEMESALRDAEGRIKDFENALNVANAEVSKLRHRNEAYQERLRKCADYEAVQDELKSLKMDVEHLKSQLTSQKTKANSEKADLLAQIGGLKQQIADQTDFPNERFKMIKEMEQQRILHDREIQSLKLREVEQIGKIEAEKAKYAELMRLFEQQGENAKEVSRELVQLRTTFAAAEQRSKRAKVEASKSADSSASYSSTHDSTPEFVKDARNRMRQLELEAESFEATYKLYRSAMPVPTSAVTPNFGFSTAIPNMEKNVENEAKNLNKFGDSFKQPERSRRVSFERKSSQQESTPSSSEMEEVQKKKLRVPNPAVELMRLTANPSMHEKKKEDKGVKLEDHMIKKNGNQVEKEISSVKADEAKSESAEPPVDPILQSYIAAISDAKPRNEEVQEVEDVMEVASIDKQSSSEYEW